MNRITKINEFFKQYPVVIVRFKKADGTTRILRCTTLDVPPMSKEPKQSDTVKTVFDLDKYQWRSFRFDSVMSLEAGE
jgi:hypothetical protein